MNTAASCLSPEQRAQLARSLEHRRQALDGQLADQLDGQSRADRAREILLQDGDDGPQRDADREVALERADRELDELGRVSRALQRVQSPDFGLCLDCGEPIAFERLRLEPWVERCVNCESRREGGGRPPRL